MNRRSVIQTVLIVQLLLFTIPSVTQTLSSPFILKTYTTQDGLPHSTVFSSMQDSRGYLWVGTFGGICRFDGQRFFNYISNDEVKSLVVSCTYEDDAGRIWMYSGSSLYYMDNKNIYPFMNGEPVSLNLVYRNGDMTKLEWWAKSKHGVFRIGKNSLQNIHPPPGIGDGYCRRIVETSKGYYYSDTTGLFFVANDGKKTSTEQFIPRTDFIVIMGYWDQKLYFYNKDGVFVFTGSGVYPLFANQLKGKQIFTSFRDSKKRIWIATRNDGILVSGSNEEEKLEHKITLPESWVTNFYEDKAGNTWIAFGEGLAKIREVKHKLFSSNEYPLLADLNTLYQFDPNTILLFSESNGLINCKKEKFHFIKNNPFKGHLVDAVCIDENNRIWCVSRQRKLLVFDNDQLTDLSNKMKVSSSRDIYLDIAFDHYRKKVWIAADRLMLGNEKEVTAFKGIDNRIILDPKLVLPLQDGNVIVLTTANNLFVIDKSDNIRNLHPFNSMIPQRIHKLFADSLGDVWISYTGLGLLHCTIQNDSNLVLIKKFTRDNGLANETIKSIVFDKKNNLWVATMTGISVIELSDPVNSNMSFLNFSVSNGLPETGLEYGRLACDAAGDIWYSTQYALMKFSANELQIKSSPPTINIEDIQLNMRETNWNLYTDSLSGIFQIPDNPVLKYYQNTISVNFKAISMTGNGDLQYSYMVKGLNKDWSANSSNENIILTKLPPGHYTLLVKARKTNSDWSVPASFIFTIQPAVWQHWWFNPFLAIVFAAFVYWLYRFRITQIRKEERVRRQLGSDLHDDIGSTLSSISYYTAAIRKQVKETNPGAIPLLDKMEKASDNTVDAMSDIVWAINPELDKGTNLISRMHSYAAEMCSLRNIQLEFVADSSFEKTKLNMDVKKNIYLVFKEALNNAVKYSECKNIHIDLAADNDSLVMKIADDGKGFDTANETAGNGLKNMQLRAKEIKASIEIISEKDKGVSVILKL